ncbi:DUF4304 domain-containing protein [Erythrobacter mangrovi]|uniref:DUF4304 domain-containing protein n=1 Tax=Erythrobacter mangrovi TaxID=2739433 RepID=A0A7D3XGW1_9SPHN|nr:DUF4304 domain-containing protein [Erythrobacter mangrovi]QKG70638.1 DUF4304 domain-containing protein [Erythrobacter mangrovi]
MVSKETKARAREFYCSLGATLREHGFRGTGGHWYRRHPFATICIGVEVSARYGLDEPITFGIGLAIDQLYDRWERPSRGKVPKLDHCHYSRSIGWLNSYFNPDPFMRLDHADRQVVDQYLSLKIRSYTTDEQFAERLNKAEVLLVEIGLPLFQSWLEPSVLLAHLDGMKPESDWDARSMLELAEAVRALPVDPAGMEFGESTIRTGR